jgi:hypothetical protein
MSRGDSVSRKSTLARPKATKRKKAAPELLLSEPNVCSVLAIDGAEQSGWSMWERGTLRSYGECDVFGDGPAKIIAQFLQTTTGPHVLVIERPFMLRFGGQTGLGTGEKIWRVQGARAGLGKRIVRVYPSTWRSRTLPKGFASKKREEVRPKEREVAAELVQLQLGRFHVRDFPIGPEAAPAILIGQWGSRSPAVRRVLPAIKPEKTYPVTVVKFGRFAIRREPKKRIHKATEGAQHMIGMWLVLDGRVTHRDDRVTQAELDRCEVRLGYANLDPSSAQYEGGDESKSWSESCQHVAHVPLAATSEQIFVGWSKVADSVERAYPAPVRAPRARKGRAHAAA